MIESTSLPSALQLRPSLSRRSMLKAVPAAALATGGFAGGFAHAVDARADDLRRSGKAMILLWMAGGPPQTETFDPKPKLSEFGSITTATAGIEVCELWPNIAKQMADLCLVRSVRNKEGEHQRASYQAHTGYLPSGSVRHPYLGSSVGERLSKTGPPTDLPLVATIAQSARELPGAGYVGVDFEPFVISKAGEPPRNLATNVTKDRYRRRLSLVDQLDEQFARGVTESLAENHRQLYRQTAALVTSPQTEAFRLDDEPDAVRRLYGETDFGRGCLLARRLVQRGVRFVEVVSPGWDLHDDLGGVLPEKAAAVDVAMTALIGDLGVRGMLDDTLVVWMGEFGRTPSVNARGGRDHFPQAFSVAMAGGGVRGGQVIGRTTDNGAAIADRPVTVGDLHATFCRSLGIDPGHEYVSPLGRPMRIVDQGSPVDEVFTG